MLKANNSIAACRCMLSCTDMKIDRGTIVTHTCSKLTIICKCLSKSSLAMLFYRTRVIVSVLLMHCEQVTRSMIDNNRWCKIPCLFQCQGKSHTLFVTAEHSKYLALRRERREGEDDNPG